MQLFKHTKPHVLIADAGKKFKEVEEVEIEDIDGKTQVDTIVTYFTVAFIPDDVTLEDCQAKYTEVDLEE